MNSSSSGFFFNTIINFPPVENGQIKMAKFITATEKLALLVDRLGKLFTPVTYDIRGNIEKLKSYYEFDEHSCILQLMKKETSKGKYIGCEKVLWLNRTLLYFELLFQEIIKILQSNNHNTPVKNLFTVAYEGSVKKYHNIVTQQIFHLICKMAPTFQQILQALEVNHDLESFVKRLMDLNNSIMIVRMQIDSFFKENSLFDYKKENI